MVGQFIDIGSQCLYALVAIRITTSRRPVLEMTNSDANRGSDKASTDAAGDRQPRTVASSEILQGDRKVLIVHGSEVYRLLVTRNDKLILQK